MGMEGVVALVVFALALGAIVVGAMSVKKSLAVALVGLIVAIPALGGSWYAWVESQSLPWALGYAAVALSALAVAVFHLLGARE